MKKKTQIERAIEALELEIVAVRSSAETQVQGLQSAIDKLREQVRKRPSRVAKLADVVR